MPSLGPSTSMVATHLPAVQVRAFIFGAAPKVAREWCPTAYKSGKTMELDRGATAGMIMHGSSHDEMMYDIRLYLCSPANAGSIKEAKYQPP